MHVTMPWIIGRNAPNFKLKYLNQNILGLKANSFYHEDAVSQLRKSGCDSRGIGRLARAAKFNQSIGEGLPRLV